MLVVAYLDLVTFPKSYGVNLRHIGVGYNGVVLDRKKLRR